MEKIEASQTGTMSEDKTESQVQSEEHGSQESQDEAPPVPPFIMFLVMFGIMLGMFLSALDMTIIATAIPYITDEFSSIADIGWYGSAFFITLATTQAAWGKAYQLLDLKWTFLVSIIVFEIGSLICGVAPNSVALIVGRSITGVGGAGTVAGCYILIAHIVSARQRPMYIGLIGAVYSIASVVGPLLGGAFTQRVSWRWCFYINLPVGGVTFALVLIFFKSPESSSTKSSFRHFLSQFDSLGLVFITAALVLFTLAMQWGGITKPWSSPDVIGTLCGFAALLVCFIAVQFWQGERSSLVLRILKKRTVWSACAFVFCINASTFLMFYYLPIYFQAIKGATPSQSGVENLPLILALSICMPISTTLVGRFGRINLYLIIGSIIISIGAGLISTLNIGSTVGQYVGYQILFGVGEGLAIQMPMIACQGQVGMEDISQTTALVMFFQVSSGAVGVAAAQSVFANRLLQAASRLAGLDASALLSVGASEISRAFSPELLPQVLAAYTDGLQSAWYLGIALAACTFPLSLIPKWSSAPP